MKFVIVVDMQHDFVDGALGSDEAFDAYLRARDYIRALEGDDYRVIFTQDTHDDNYLNTFEGKNLPVPHCIKDSFGWKIMGELRNEFANNPMVVEKTTFGSFQLPIDMKEVLMFREDLDEIEIFGLCTDICVISNALILRAAFPNTKITCLANLSAGTTPANHVNALEVMKACQIDVAYIGKAEVND